MESMLQIGDVLTGRYRIDAQGEPQDIGMAYEAHDLHYERTVVVLVLEPRFSRDEDALRRLLQTQQAVIDLAVPELVPIEDAGVIDGQFYLVRSMVEGYTLAGLLASNDSLASDVAVRIALNLCDALAPLHRAGFVHGSLSPYSVLVQDSGQVLLTDIGLLPALRPASLSPGRLWGRAPSLSPEQAAGEHLHPSSDVYVIGCLLYQMLAGRPPFRGQDEAVLAVRHLRHDPPSLQVLVPDVPPRLADIVQKCLAKEPAARYRNAGQLASILRSQVSPEQPFPTIPHPVIPAKGGSRPPRSLIPDSSDPAIPGASHPVVPDSSPPVIPAEAGIQPSSPSGAGIHTRDRLVVPPPPVGGIQRQEEYLDDWSEEAESGDWLMVALVVAALIAVLGLIPLWRAVYRRYAAPPPAPPPATYRMPGGDGVQLSIPSGGLTDGTTAWSKLDDFGLVWYNLAVTDQPVSWTEVTSPGRIAWFGSQDYDFWEQFVINCECNT